MTRHECIRTGPGWLSVSPQFRSVSLNEYWTRNSIATKGTGLFLLIFKRTNSICSLTTGAVLKKPDNRGRCCPTAPGRTTKHVTLVRKTQNKSSYETQIKTMEPGHPYPFTSLKGVIPPFQCFVQPFPIKT